MRELASTYLRRLWGAVMLGSCLVLFSGAAAAQYPLVKQIIIKDSPLSVEFDVTGRAPVKVIRIGDREVLVALKNVTLARGFKISGKDNPALSSVNVEELDGNVVAVVVTGKQAYGKIGSAFNADDTRLRVSLEQAPAPVPARPKPALPAESRQAPKEKTASKPETPPVPQKDVSIPQTPPAPVPPVVQPPAPRPAAKEAETPKADLKKEPVKPEVATPRPKKTARLTAPPEYVPPKRRAGQFKGDISDIHRGEDPLFGCEVKSVSNAMLLIKKELYTEAYDILDQYMMQENFLCMEQVHFLKAYVYYMGVEQEDLAGLMVAERMFQDALVSYPQSQLMPFAYSAMGMIQVRLKNLSAAEGYFNIVRQGYPAYSGMPEIQYHLAGIYDEKGHKDKALKLYKEVFESPINNSYIPDAGVGYGKALFDKRRYFDALSVLNYVVKNDMKKVYESPDLLMYTANTNFELGLSRPARENYMRVLNLYPDIGDKDMVLSKVGDAYGMENQEQKALKIYELVREKFPDTPGFINASIGIARYLENDDEKIEIYEMVKNRFPENTYARIAMMRLAEIYQKNGEYDKCIQEIEDLLSTHPRGLRYEAVKLMQRAYEALFKEKLKADEYTSVLNRYESEYTKLDKMSSRVLAFQVGTSYLKAGLYEEAFNQLITSYKQYRRSERSPELLFGLGIAMDESGRDEDAVKLLDSFSKRFPRSPDRVEALIRMGQIHFEKNRLDRSDAAFRRAYALSKKPFDRGEILMRHSGVLLQQGNLKAAAALRERAVEEYARAPGQNYEAMGTAYKLLGDTYLNLKSYVQAADAFSKALGFSQGDRAKSNIGFLLGDAYQKGNILDKAKETFEQVAQSYDSVWARMAQQRLSTLSMSENMINS